jgi:hypothetical protein
MLLVTTKLLLKRKSPASKKRPAGPFFMSAQSF